MDQQLDDSLNLDDEAMAVDFENSVECNVSQSDIIEDKQPEEVSIEQLHTAMDLEHIEGDELMVEDESEEMIADLTTMSGADMPMLGGEEEVLGDSEENEEANVKMELLSQTEAILPDLDAVLEVPTLVPVIPKSTHSITTVNTQGNRLTSAAMKPLAIAPKPVTVLSTKSISLPSKKTFTTLQPNQRTNTFLGVDGSGRQMLIMAKIPQTRVNSAPSRAIINNVGNGTPKLKLVTRAPQPLLFVADGNTSKLPFHAKPSFVTKKQCILTSGFNKEASAHFTTTKKIVPATGITPMNIPKVNVQAAVNSTSTVTTPKYLTLQQAQQLGLLTNSPNLKVQQVLNVANKPMQSIQAVRPMKSQPFVRSPTKILPAPTPGQAGKIVLPSGKQTVVIRPSTPKAAQYVRLVPANIANAVVGNTPVPKLAAISKFKQSPIAPRPAENTISLATTLASSGTGQRTLLSVAGGKTVLLSDGLSSFIQMSTNKVQTALVPTNAASATIKKITTKPQQKLIPVTLSFASSLQKISTTNTALTTTSLSSRLSAIPMQTTKSQETVVAPETMQLGVLSSDDVAPGNDLEPEDSKASLRLLTTSMKNENAQEQEMDIEEAYVEALEPEGADTSEENFDSAEPAGEDDTTIEDDSPATQHVLMLPASFLQQINNQESLKALAKSGDIEIKEELLSQLDFPPGTKLPIPALDNPALDLGMRPRKPCNCAKSQCLKLYCDCFANGEFCHQCNCNNCFNNLENEEERQKAIKSCLERNPNAFRPKIGKAKSLIGHESMIRRHNKGCNCKRSGCLKNYCECYEAKIACSANCKCVGCRNVEESVERARTSSSSRVTDLRRISVGVAADDTSVNTSSLSNRAGSHSISASFKATAAAPPLHAKQPCSFMTSDVIDAVCQCLLAAAGESTTDNHHRAPSPGGPATSDPIRRVLEEYARCLQDIIGAARHAQPQEEVVE